MVQGLERDYDISFYPEDLSELVFPEVLFITNEQMRNNYLQYWRAVSFDLTFSLIKEQRITPIAKKRYRLKKGKLVEEE